MDVFTIDIMAEQVDALAGAGITLTYPSNRMLRTEDPIIGTFFDDNISDILYFFSEEESAGETTLQLDIATLGQQFVSGTGIIATLTFQATSVGNFELQFDNNTTLRNALNDEIEYEQLVNGLIKVQ